MYEITLTKFERDLLLLRLKGLIVSRTDEEVFAVKSMIQKLTNASIEEIVCCVCDGECEMDTEYEGSAICKDKSCSVHEE